MRNLAVVSSKKQFIEYSVDGVTLLRYVYRTDQAADEVPKPYFHPLQTLSGNPVTIYRPNDHRWHTGLMMTMSHLADMNFWGGPSYVEGEGYQRLGNHGRIDHVSFENIEIATDHFALTETIEWKPDAATIWLRESRRMQITEINRNASYWTLRHTMSFQNVSAQTLAIGSPTTHGRPDAGYGSLFWRGPRSFIGGKVTGPEPREEYRGERFPWLAYTATQDEVDDLSTLLFVDDPSNPRYPNKWFVRNTPYACVSYSFMFDEAYEMAPGDSLSLTYHTVIFDGVPDVDTLAQVAKKAQQG